MSWVFTLLIAVVTAGVGMVAAGGVGLLTVDWHRISGFEGKSGYFVVLLGLVGIVVGFIVGAIASRMVGADTLPRNLGGLAAGVGVVLAMAGVFAGLSRLTADFPPTLDGRPIELDVEVRLPEGVDPPPLEPGSHVEVMLYSGQSAAWSPDTEPDAGRRDDGRWVFTRTFGVTSSLPERRICVRFGGGTGHYIPIPLAGRPTAADTQWSAWHPVTYLGGVGKPSPEQILEARYRVRAEGETEPEAQP